MRLGRDLVRALRFPLWAMGAAAWLSCTGCLMRASLATSTGPPPPGYYWSNEPEQQVHVGETVAFELVLTDTSGRFMPATGPSDYGVLLIGHDRLETAADEDGRFKFSYPFTRYRAGDEVVVFGGVYEQRVHRDYMLIQDEWLACESPSDMPDRRLASDEIELSVYATQVEFVVESPGADLAADTGVIRFHKADGTVASVYVEMPGRPGFSMQGPGPKGRHVVRYSPTGDQLAGRGTTSVELLIYDDQGRAITRSITLETP